MRRAALLLLLTAASCGGDDGPPTFQERTAAEWAEALADDTRLEAAHRQLRGGGKDALPVLAELLAAEAPAPLVAAELLGRLGADAAAAVPQLKEALGSPEASVRGMAAMALGRIGPPAKSALVKLHDVLYDKDGRVRVAAALAAWGIAGDSRTATEVLVGVLASGDADLRRMAVEGLGELGPAAVDLLTVATADKDPDVRAAAHAALKKIKGKG